MPVVGDIVRKDKGLKNCNRELPNLNLNQPQKVYRAGIIGAGWIALEAPDNHRDAYLNNQRIQFVGQYDINPAKSDFVRLGHLVIWKPDILSVCTPTETHCKIVCDIAPYVKAIWCEKPIALTLKDADAMIDTCTKYGTLLFVNHQRNYMTPKFRFSRGWIHTGTHAFALLRELFGEIVVLDKKHVKGRDGGQKIEIEYVDTDEHIFEFDLTHNRDVMLPKVLDAIIRALDSEQRTYSAEDAREALRVCLEMERLNEKS